MAGLSTGMALEAPKQPISALTGNGRKDGNSTGSSEGKNVGEKGKIGDDKGTSVVGGRKTPGTFLPKSNEILALTIKFDGLEAHIQYMKDHALIAMFIGIWPIEKNLIWWINHHWKPKGGYELRLGAKGFSQ